MKKIILLAITMALSATSFAQVGIGTTSPDASAALDVESTTQMFLPPRMTEVQMNAISSPAEGGMVYCTDCSPKGVYVYNGSSFINTVTGEVTTPGNTGLGSTLTTVGGDGVAFSTNTTCATKTISATACSTAELANGIGADPDGGGYTVVQIGDAISGYNQCWMAENMQDGSGPANAWVNATDNGWYGYLGDSDQTPDTAPTTDGDGTNGTAVAYNEKEGFVYQWFAAMNGTTAERSQGICPTGWHIPSDCEWMFLENNLGMSIAKQKATGWRGTEGTKLKENGSSNFEGLLAGYRNAIGTFTSRGTNAVYWSSSPSGSDAYSRTLTSGHATVYRDTDDKAFAWSVRCLKD